MLFYPAYLLFLCQCLLTESAIVRNAAYILCISKRQQPRPTTNEESSSKKRANGIDSILKSFCLVEEEKKYESCLSARVHRL